jgi:hypothetical protein
MVAAESTRKCWPSLGLLRGFSAATIFAKFNPLSCRETGV